MPRQELPALTPGTSLQMLTPSPKLTDPDTPPTCSPRDNIKPSRGLEQSCHSNAVNDIKSPLRFDDFEPSFLFQYSEPLSPVFDNCKKICRNNRLVYTLNSINNVLVCRLEPVHLRCYTTNRTYPIKASLTSLLNI